MEFHGSADGTIASSGGSHRNECLPTIPHYIREWSKRESYGLTNKITSLYGGRSTSMSMEEGKEGRACDPLLDGWLGHAWQAPSLMMIIRRGRASTLLLSLWTSSTSTLC